MNTAQAMNLCRLMMANIRAQHEMMTMLFETLTDEVDGPVLMATPPGTGEPPLAGGAPCEGPAAQTGLLDLDTLWKAKLARLDPMAPPGKVYGVKAGYVLHPLADAPEPKTRQPGLRREPPEGGSPVPGEYPVFSLNDSVLSSRSLHPSSPHPTPMLGATCPFALCQTPWVCAQGTVCANRE